MIYTSKNPFIYRRFSIFYIFFFARGFHRNSLYDHYQFSPLQVVGFVAITIHWLLKTTLLQPLVVNYQTARFPTKYLDRIARAIHKDKHFATERIAMHFRANHSAKSIKAFAHIGRIPKIIVTQRIAQREHNSGW